MNKKILLIEDNKEMRENTAEILELANYTVITAKNGKEGVDLCKKENPDLIICDIMMPELDGYGVLHMLSKNEDTASIPFIYLSAKAERTDLRKGMEMGADDYITKPFDDIELLNAVESRIKRTEILKKEFNGSIEDLREFVSGGAGLDAVKDLSKEHYSRTYRKKENIYTEGSHPKMLYFITKGKVKAYKSNEQGKEFITGLYNEGDFFGYIALLEESKYSDSAMALEDAEITAIPKEEFFTLIYKNQQVSRKFIHMLSNNLREKEDQLIKLAYNSVRKRVAEALLSLASRYKKNDEPVFSMSISREDLANLAGTATETTIRTLSDFKEENLVEVKGSSITILDLEKLAKLKN